MKKELYVLVDEVMSQLGEDSNIKEELVEQFIDRYATMTCTETGYKNLPSQFYPYVIDATIETCQRLGNEGMSNRSELGVNTSYSYKDIEESIRSKVKGKKNPRLFLGYWS